MSKGIDCAHKITVAEAAQIRAAGYTFACRYLVPCSGSLAWKALTASEARALSDVGLDILVVWETTANRCKDGAAAGTADGAAARKLAESMGIPATAVLYFAVDYDAGSEDYAVIEAYLRAARANSGGYEVGVYGSYGVVEAMAARGACRGFWQCYAWSYGKKSAHRNVYQYKNGCTVAGVSADLDEACDGAGLWSYRTAAVTAAESEDDMVRYAKLADIPNDFGFRDIVDKLMTAGVIGGDGSDKTGNGDVIDLSHDQVRSLVFEYRGGAFDRALMAHGMSPVVQV